MKIMQITNHLIYLHISYHFLTLLNEQKICSYTEIHEVSRWTDTVEEMKRRGSVKGIRYENKSSILNKNNIYVESNWEVITNNNLTINQ